MVRKVRKDAATEVKDGYMAEIDQQIDDLFVNFEDDEFSDDILLQGEPEVEV